jgi:hypothetical protein
MKMILLAMSSALILGLTIPAISAEHDRGGNGGGGGAMSRGGQSGGGGGSFAPAGRSGPSGNFSAGARQSFSAGPTRNFSGGDVRMGERGDHDRGHFRGDRNFSFGVYPGYDTYAYDDDCYQWRQVRSRYGWHWARVWVCY